jgi:hypothetical protein
MEKAAFNGKMGHTMRAISLMGVSKGLGDTILLI